MLSLSLFLWNFLSAPFTHIGDPAKTQTRVPHPKQTSSFPLKLHHSSLFTQHKHYETSFKKLHFPPSQRHSSRECESYLCCCIPHAGSNCPLSFHFNNACSNGSQAKTIWESQRPLRDRYTNTSIVLLPKSLPLVVTLCDRAPATQLCTNTTRHKLMPVELLTGSTAHTDRLQISVYCFCESINNISRN